MKKPVIILIFILLLMVLRWGFLAQPAFAFFSSDDSVPLLMV